MLKTSETYGVTVVLNDGQAMNCTLLSKPDGLTLAAVAEAQGVSAELKEAATFARSLVIPALGEDDTKTHITVAGTLIGAILIETKSAYVWQARKPRKSKPTETGETGETAEPKRKRKSKPETPKTPETKNGESVAK